MSAESNFATHAAFLALVEACEEIVAEHEHKIRKFEEEHGLVRVEGFDPFGETTAVSWARLALAKAKGTI